MEFDSALGGQSGQRSDGRFEELLNVYGLEAHNHFAADYFFGVEQFIGQPDKTSEIGFNSGYSVFRLIGKVTKCTGRKKGEKSLNGSQRRSQIVSDAAQQIENLLVIAGVGKALRRDGDLIWAFFFLDREESCNGRAESLGVVCLRYRMAGKGGMIAASDLADCSVRMLLAATAFPIEFYMNHAGRRQQNCASHINGYSVVSHFPGSSARVHVVRDEGLPGAKRCVDADEGAMLVNEAAALFPIGVFDRDDFLGTFAGFADYARNGFGDPTADNVGGRIFGAHRI